MQHSETIDFGIDLGTTNSLITVMKEGKPFIIPNSSGNPMTPSCVGLDGDGSFVVGEKAYNGAREFKRLMGTLEKHSLTKLSPTEMSTLVLKNLVLDVVREFDYTPECVVITVPASFEISQLEATHQAATAAGFRQVVLLQEPIAASIAAKVSSQESGFFLVYDLGGGTFDISLMSTAKNGVFRVEDHEGDNFLGGRDCDWKIVDWIVEQLNLPGFHRENPSYHFAFNQLKEIATQAKIELSSKDKAQIQIESLPKVPDFKGVSLELSREEFEARISPTIEKTINYCKKVLQRNDLKAKDLNYIVLVGGGTLMPLVQKRLTETFEVALKQTAEPMTLVALGACLFAASEKRQQFETKIEKEWFQLEYERLTQSDTVLIVGKWLDSAPPSYHFFLKNTKTQQEEELQLDEKQRFLKRLQLPNDGENRFLIEIKESSGKIIGEQFVVVLKGQKISAPPLSRSLGVWLADNSNAVYLAKGIPLPARKTRKHFTSRTIHPGDLNAVFEVKVVQGENSNAKRNRLVGKIEVPGIRLNNTIQENSEVLVTMTADRSGVVKAKAFIPKLEQEFESVITLAMNVPEVKDLEDDLMQQKERLKKLTELQKKTFQETKNQILEAEQEIRLAKSGDLDASLKVKRELLEIAATLDELEEEAEWPLIQEEYEELLKETFEAIASEGDTAQKQQYNLLKQEVEESITNQDSSQIQKKLDSLARLKWEVLLSSPRFWEESFRDILENPDWITDRKKGVLLLDQGEKHLRNGDLEELKEITKQLWSLIPGHMKHLASDLR